MLIRRCGVRYVLVEELTGLLGSHTPHARTHVLSLSPPPGRSLFGKGLLTELRHCVTEEMELEKITQSWIDDASRSCDDLEM